MCIACAESYFPPICEYTSKEIGFKRRGVQTVLLFCQIFSDGHLTNSNLWATDGFSSLEVVFPADNCIKIREDSWALLS